VWRIRKAGPPGAPFEPQGLTDFAGSGPGGVLDIPVRHPVNEDGDVESCRTWPTIGESVGVPGVFGVGVRNLRTRPGPALRVDGFPLCNQAVALGDSGVVAGGPTAR
jgi:hypothetical protein